MIEVKTCGEARLSRLIRGRLAVTTAGPSFTDLTASLCGWLARMDAGEGLVCAFVTHTTASLAVQENADADVQRDLLDALARLAPVDAPYRHRSEGPDDMPAHLKALLSDTSVVIDVTGGRLALGSWQALYLIEHRTGGRLRIVRMTFIGT